MYQQLGEPYRRPGGTMTWLRNIGNLFGFGGKNIVVDSGLGFHLVNGISRTYTADIDRLDGVRIDLIIITHLHTDHFGGVIALAKRHPEAIVIMSQPTWLGGWILASDTLKIAENNQKQAKYRGEDPEPLLYDYGDMVDFFNERVVSDGQPDSRGLSHTQWISPWKGWEIGFHNCGHTRGAMSIFILPPHGRPIYITGDTCSHNQELTLGVLVPSQEFLGDFLKRKGMVLITEATNGARAYNQAIRDAEKAKLIAKALEVKARGGRMFNPTFAEGRSASAVSIYAEARIPSHVDGMARDFLENYADPKSLWCEDDIPFPLDTLKRLGLLFLFERTDGSRESRDIANAHRINADRGYDECAPFSPIISPSSTMDKGFAVHHATEILPQKESAVVFLGHVFANSPSAELMEMNDPTYRVEKGRTIKLNGVPVDVRCEVLRVYLTGHDGAEGLIERVKIVGENAPDPREVVVIGHHGDDENRAGLQKGVEALGLKYLDGTYLKEYDL